MKTATETTQMKYLRITLRITRMDKVINEHMRAVLNSSIK